MNKRKVKRDKYANDIAKEIRFQFVRYGGIAENERIFGMLEKWMNSTGKEKYKRPK